MQNIKNREIWVDNVKLTACIFVALGHFFQSMIPVNIISENNLYLWFNQTIYYFHVPLFFICSGYLYQKYNTINNFKSYKNNTFKKTLALGIPYFTFSIATWILKMIFSGSVNNKNNCGLLDTLFIHPTSAYWYLYALFFIFLITPTLKNKKSATIALTIAMLFKISTTFFNGFGVSPIDYILRNEIWFVIGMCLSVYGTQKLSEKIKYSTLVFTITIFIISSIIISHFKINNNMLSFVLGLIACFTIISFNIIKFRNNQQGKILGFLTKYTMPIYLMHTLFAAALRSLLFKLNIQTPIIHIILGIAISFIGPIVAAMIMKKQNVLNFSFILQNLLKLKIQNNRLVRMSVNNKTLILKQL